MLGDDPRLQRFVEEVAERNGGRVFNPDGSSLGTYLVSDFLRTRGAMAGGRTRTRPSTRRPA